MKDFILKSCSYNTVHKLRFKHSSFDLFDNSFLEEEILKTCVRGYAFKLRTSQPNIILHSCLHSFWLIVIILLVGTGYVCNMHLGPTLYPMDIVRIFNFGNDTCKR